MNKYTPYYIFKCIEQYFVYDTTTYRFYRIDKNIALYLRLCLKYKRDIADRLWRSHATSYLPKEYIDDVSTTISKLEALGLFDSPKHLYSNFKKNLNRELDSFSRYPLVGMELCITNSCNLSCKYCFCKAGRDYAQTGNMSEEIAFKAIDLLLKNSKNKKKLNVAFFGG